METVDVPSYFLCPISLQIMTDPVTLSTGITYDRDSIERWIFAGKNATCPVTKQPLLPPAAADLTPNHTLRRLIQSWCTANAAQGVDRIPTPRAPVGQAQIARLLDQAGSPQSRLASLRKLKAVVSESETNRRSVEISGAVDVLASIVTTSVTREEFCDVLEPTNDACHEALCILQSLQISEHRLVDLVTKNEDFVQSLTVILQRANYQSRAYTLLLVKSIVSAISPARLMSLRRELLQEIVNALRDQISHQVTKAALETLIGLCPWGRNRIKIVEAGAVQVLVELLLDQPEKRVCEMALVVLDKLCGCAEGRAAITGHSAGVAVVSEKMLRVSAVATDRAVRVLHSVSRFSGTAAVVQEMVQVGAVARLYLMLQVDCGAKAKEKARDILRLHFRVWRNSPCLSPQLQAPYAPF